MQVDVTFNGWTREGYWENGSLYHGKLGRVIYQEPLFATPEPAEFADPTFTVPKTHEGYLFVFSEPEKICLSIENKLADWQMDCWYGDE